MNFELSLRTESLFTDKSGGITKAPVVLYKYLNKYTIIIFKMLNNGASKIDFRCILRFAFLIPANLNIYIIHKLFLLGDYQQYNKNKKIYK